MLNLIDSVIAGYPLLIVGILQVVVVGWIYGTDNLIRDIERMIGPKPKWLWTIFIISWKFICPIVLIVRVFSFYRSIAPCHHDHIQVILYYFIIFKAIIVASLILPSNEMTLKGIPYPFYSKVIGFVIAAIPISAIFIFGAIQAFKYEFNWVSKLSVLGDIHFKFPMFFIIAF